MADKTEIERRITVVRDDKGVVLSAAKTMATVFTDDDGKSYEAGSRDVDLTPEELAAVFGNAAAQQARADAAEAKVAAALAALA